MAKIVCDLDGLLEHLHAEIQFYGPTGEHNNAPVLKEIRDALQSFEFEPSSTASQRFRLVEIAFRNILERQLQFAEPDGINEMGRGVVRLADTVLAAMEKEPPTRIEKRAHMEAGPVLADLRAEVQQGLNNNLQIYAENPTEEPRDLAFRRGVQSCFEDVLDRIDRAIKKARKPEAEKQND